ncbi:hypothetical protein [Sulfurimonas marina]|uniref:Uncharacterized protein n=1 Tax=Sulfurimonas marina TaxID=2590551 RepID=A0A7M1AT45_9BACT|nr:hypothetical protein [Sulfurimonas marina]QOP40576.1 hypothetical protein FJR03_01995 [Sulfurimonas marina]
MKKVKLILSGLLFAMLFFSMHDYILTQTDLAGGVEKQKTLTKMEHNVFHTPMILTDLDTDFELAFIEKSIYPLKNFVIINFTNSLFKPPQHI